LPTILELALKENDHTTQQFLQCFVEEQLEEVSSMDKLPAWSGAPERTACCLSKTTWPGRRPRATKRS